MKKLYYTIGEVSKILEEEQYTLRYWEKEFDFLKPRKNRAGKRAYSEKDLNLLKLIKKFIRDDKLSVQEANSKIKKILHENSSILETQKIQIPFNENARINKNNLVIDEKLKNEIISILREIAEYLKTY